MRTANSWSSLWARLLCCVGSCGLVIGCAVAQESSETEIREEIAAANMRDAVIVDCQLPGKLRKLGGTRTYLTPGQLIRTAAVTCRSRGGEYTLGDLASGTLSLQRWTGPAEDGDAEAQYYVARIYANGMDNVPVSYDQAAVWYQKASDQGHNEAMQELGYLYEQGLGVEQDALLALNLQRKASGLGDDLDYAYKIADAEAIADDLTERLAIANAALRDSQLEAQRMEDRLAHARNTSRAHEQRAAELLAELNARRDIPAGQPQADVSALEADLDVAKQELATSQAEIVSLEKERDAVNAQLALQLLGGQAAQLELRELRARTATAEQKTEDLSEQLADNQQRLIQTDQELQELRLAYRDQSDQLAADTLRLSAARTKSASDAAAYVAAQQAKLAAKSARVATLESEVNSLREQLSAVQGADETANLRQALQQQQARYDTELAELRAEREQLEVDSNRNEQQLTALFNTAKQQLKTMGLELQRRKVEIDTLAAEADQLRGRVGELENEQILAYEQSGAEASRLSAQLTQSREQAAALRNTLAQVQAEKSVLNAELASKQAELQTALAAGQAAETAEIELLNAQIAASRSTIKAKDLRISTLEKQVRDMDFELSELKAAAGSEPQMPVEMQNAMAVLQLARSSEEPNLGNFHALLIANEKYENLEDLTTPVRDSYEIGKMLTEHYGFSVEVVENATTDDIMRTLHRYSNTMTAEDNLLIYYAGRGSTPTGPPDRAYWMGVDYDPEVLTGRLLAEHVSEKIKHISAQRILVVTDSCFSKRRVQKTSFTVGRGLDPKRFKLLARFQSRNVLMSGANLPRVNDNGDSRHSLFAHYFMEVLRRNENVLSGEMLYFQMAQRIQEQFDDPERATPTYNSLQGAGHKAGDFFFVPTPSETMMAGGGTTETAAYR
ncbi:MAG: caspase family protein [Pseudomonadota bacterium]